MNRRDLFHPRLLAHAAGQVLGALEKCSLPSASAPQEIALVRLGWRAMATGWEIVFPFDTPEPFETAQEAFTLLDQLEDQLTVYREHSEVSLLNHQASSRAVSVEPRLFELLELSAWLTDQSEGAFDITAGALIKAWGFFRGPRCVPSPEQLQHALDRVGMHHVILDPTLRTLHYRRQGVEINLGSIGKGYALDRLLEQLHHSGKIPAVLLHGGSSSVYAKGDPLGRDSGWRVRIKHPWRPGRFLAEVILRDRALGTSAATFQHLVYQGKKLGHLLDPRSGWPAEGLASVSVVAPTATLADAFSTIFFVNGLEWTQRYLQTHPQLGAIVLPEGEIQPQVFNLSPAEYTLLTQGG